MASCGSTAHAIHRFGVPTLCQYLRGTWQLTRTMRHTETKALMGTVDGAVATFATLRSLYIQGLQLKARGRGAASAATAGA